MKNDSINSGLLIVKYTSIPKFPDTPEKEEGHIDKNWANRKDFVKDKIPALDGWHVKLFISFFDIMGKDLLEVAKLYRREGIMAGSINSTFIALILKKENLDDSSNFIPIALCNLI